MANRITIAPTLNLFEVQSPQINPWLKEIERRFNFYSGSSNPSASDVPEGQWIWWRNTTTGVVSLWANYNGSLTNIISITLGTGVATWLATPSSANLAAAVTDETGTGALVFANTPTLVTPVLGTPTSGTLTNCTGLPVSTGVSGLGANVATFLATPSSANLRAALTDESGTGAALFAGGNIGAATGTSLAVTGALTSSGGGIGYATGAGGTITQNTSKSTGVTLNTLTGQITMNNASLNNRTAVSFTLTNSTIAANDLIVVNHVSTGTIGAYLVNGGGTSAGGSATITVYNNQSAGSLSEAIVLGFAVIKAVTS